MVTEQRLRAAVAVLEWAARRYAGDPEGAEEVPALFGALSALQWCLDPDRFRPSGVTSSSAHLFAELLGRLSRERVAPDSEPAGEG